MEQKSKIHAEKIYQIKKHFKALKLRAILLWLAFNIVADSLAIIFLSVEITISALLIALIISTMILINYLNRLDKIRIAQETKLLEETPISRLKI